MSATDEQFAFLLDLARLIFWASENGYTVTGGELWRPETTAWTNSLPPESTLTAKTKDGKEVHYWNSVGGSGISKSLHIRRLAIDLNLIKDGKLAQSVDDYRELGEYWEMLSPLNRWGGRFQHPRPDAPHFERNSP